MLKIQANTGNNTTKQILSLLYEQGAATASEIADNLALNVVGIRRHLKKLLTESRIELVDKPTLVKNVGRPQVWYQLTLKERENFSGIYTEIYKNMLKQVCESLKDLPENLLYNTASVAFKKLLAHYDDRTSQKSQVDLTTLETYLRKYGFASDIYHEGTTVKFQNKACPFASLVTDSPEFCRAESDTLSRLLNARVKTIRARNQSNPFCEIVLEEKQA